MVAAALTTKLTALRYCILSVLPIDSQADVLVHMIGDISEKADHVKFLEQVISYTSLRADRAQYYVQAGAAQSHSRLFQASH